jgi:hypothetical protein
MLLGSLGISAPVLAQCAADVAPPPQYAAWTDARPVASASDEAGLAAAPFAVGQAIDLTLHPDGEVAYLTLPKGEGEASSFGGMASFEVTQPGLYRVALGLSVWVDVVSDGQPAETVAFGRGEDCSPVRKRVEFRLEPGPHVLEISGSTKPEMRLMVIRLGD